MTEMHIPMRSQYLVDAPVKRVEAVLSRNLSLKNLVTNEWVHMTIRDPDSGVYYQLSGTPGKKAFAPVNAPPNRVNLAKHVNFHDGFEKHKRHGSRVKRREDVIFTLSLIGLMGAWAIPVFTVALPYGGQIGFLTSSASLIRAVIVTTASSLLTLIIFIFSRRYLHGEHTYERYFTLCIIMLFAFNWVSTSFDPMIMSAGYTLLGMASTFLVGTYNERQSVRINASFVFLMYKAGDLCMLFGAASFHNLGVRTTNDLTSVDLRSDSAAFSALALLGGAFFKSSQFPLTGLLAMSMEGPTPATALEAGLCSHVGIIMLASNMPLWYHFPWARGLVGCLGAFNAIYAGLICQTMADRKGAIAYATSATIGQIYVVLAFGWGDLAIFFAFAHTVCRMNQIITVCDSIMHAKKLRAALDGHHPFFAPIDPPMWLYRLAWRCRRLDRDLLELPRWTTYGTMSTTRLSPRTQMLIAALAFLFGVAVDICTTAIPRLEVVYMRAMHEHLAATVVVCIVHAALSVALIRFVFYHALDSRRFDYSYLNLDEGPEGTVARATAMKEVA